MRRALLIPLFAAALAAGCGEAAGDGGLRVVASTPVVADLARGVAGPGVEVRSLVPAGADPHDYELRPEDAEALAEAALVLRSGGELDEWLDDALEAAGAGARTVTVGETGEDPHWWHDPRLAERAAERIGAALAEADAARADGHRRRAGALAARIRTLDAAIAECVATIPAGRRKLVTTHDALGHFARRYGFEVVGTVIPSLSTQGQPSAGDTARLARDIRAAGVRTVFPESSVSAKVEAAVAREAGARLGPPLQADTLAEGVGYLEAMAANARAIAAGLGGRAESCPAA